MNEGLEDCSYFFVFLSKASLLSEMVAREWQSALYERTRHGLRFVPVLLEPVDVPVIFRDISHLNYYADGPAVVLEQMVGIIKGINPFVPLESQPNITYSEQISENNHVVLISANLYVQSIAHFLFLPDCDIGQLVFSPNLSEYTSTITEVDVGSLKKQGYWISIDRPLAPGFPFKIVISHKYAAVFSLHVLQEVKSNEFQLLKKVNHMTNG